MTDEEQEIERLKQRGEAKQTLLQKYAEILAKRIEGPTTLENREVDILLLTAEVFAEKLLTQMHRVANESQEQINAAINEQSPDENSENTVVRFRPH